MRETAEVFADLFGVLLEPGSVSTLCQEVSIALDEPYEQVRLQVETETHANVDETGWKQADERRWLWVAVTALCTLFVVAKNRSAAVPTAPTVSAAPHRRSCLPRESGPECARLHPISSRRGGPT
jgi:hypothetical protein